MEFDISKIKYDGWNIRKKSKLPKGLTPELAEIIGILLGDGGLYKYNKNKYTTVVFNKNEVCYLNYVKKLIEDYFAPYIFSFYEDKSEHKLHNNSVYIGKFLLKSGMKAGNKVKNNVEIPSWIFKKNFLKNVIRGLFDSDGCVYNKYGHYLQIQFKFACYSLISSVRNALIYLDFNPTRIQRETRPDGLVGYKIYLSRQGEIKRFFEEIGPGNKKHIERYKKIKNGEARI